MKAKFLTGTPWELGKMFILRENKSVAPSPSCFSSAVQTEAGGKAEGCSAHPQHSRGVVRTWESVPWVALSRRLIFTAHSYFSQGAAEVQARPDKGEKKSRSQHQMSFFISIAFQVAMHQIVCLFAPGALSSSVYYYILLFWPCLETMSGCVCSGSFRARNSKRGTISSVAGRKVSSDSVITADSILGFAISMHGHA